MKDGWIDGLVALILLIICGYGWVLNIYKLVKLDFEPPYKAEVIRTIGIPTGIVVSVIGYMNFDEENNNE